MDTSHLSHSDCPIAGEETLERALELFRGPRQRERVTAMGTAEGFAASFRGKWAAAQWRGFDELRRRLALAGVRTVERRMGPRGRRRWVIDACPLSEVEVAAWEDGWMERIPALLAAGITTASQARVFLLERCPPSAEVPGPVLDPGTAARVEPVLRVIAAANPRLLRATAWRTVTPAQWRHLADLAERVSSDVLAVLADGWEGDVEGLLTAAGGCALPGWIATES